MCGATYVTSAILMAALDTRQRFQLSYWDSAIIEASRAMGCAEVLSEDLGDGQDYAHRSTTESNRGYADRHSTI
jgi:predicted nucleic acid-binding protein